MVKGVLIGVQYPPIRDTGVRGHSLKAFISTMSFFRATVVRQIIKTSILHFLLPVMLSLHHLVQNPKRLFEKRLFLLLMTDDGHNEE